MFCVSECNLNVWEKKIGPVLISSLFGMKFGVTMNGFWFCTRDKDFYILFKHFFPNTWLSKGIFSWCKGCSISYHFAKLKKKVTYIRGETQKQKQKNARSKVYHFIWAVMHHFLRKYKKNHYYLLIAATKTKTSYSKWH
jgi:hypothetical protein